MQFARSFARSTDIFLRDSGFLEKVAETCIVNMTCNGNPGKYIPTTLFYDNKFVIILLLYLIYLFSNFIIDRC